MYFDFRFDILNRFGVNHECDGQTDRQTDRQTDGQTESPLATARSIIVRRTLKIQQTIYCNFRVHLQLLADHDDVTDCISTDASRPTYNHWLEIDESNMAKPTVHPVTLYAWWWVNGNESQLDAMFLCMLYDFSGLSTGVKGPIVPRTLTWWKIFCIWPQKLWPILSMLVTNRIFVWVLHCPNFVLN